MTILKVGLLVNPLAGMGGSLALKGSDGDEIRTLAAATDPDDLTRSMVRVQRAMTVVTGHSHKIDFFTCAGAMGQQALDACGVDYELCDYRAQGQTTAADTIAAAIALRKMGIDILVFAGGDGTARNVYDALGEHFPVLGIPAGVKMHSGVFGVSPEACGELLLILGQAGLVGLSAGEVRDIDEDAFREDRVKSRYYGEMLVPGEGRYLQHTKIGGRESVDLVAADIAAWIVEELEDDCTYFIGPGSTTAAIMDELVLPNTLLGVDVVRNGELLAADVEEGDLLEWTSNGDAGCRIIVTLIGGQGYVFGRGNQQFSPAVIRAVGEDRIIIVATKSKLTSLGNRPILVDTNDRDLDVALRGYRPIITGYRDQVLYPLGEHG